MATFENAKALGVEVKQEWLATLDMRTRYSHRRLDGEKVEVGGTFSNGLRYPGDPQGSYAETCNCRCTLVAAIDGVDASDAERWSRLPEGMTYAEWKWGLERGISAKTSASADTAVDFGYIGSSEYKAKFSGLGVSADTGEVVAKSSHASEDLGTALTGKIEATVKESAPREPIGMHNHPNNLPPTGSDIATAANRKYAFGLVAGHDGSLYWYTVADGEIIPGYAFDMKVKRMIGQGMSEHDAIVRTLDQSETNGRISWRKL